MSSEKVSLFVSGHGVELQYLQSGECISGNTMQGPKTVMLLWHQSVLPSFVQHQLFVGPGTYQTQKGHVRGRIFLSLSTTEDQPNCCETFENFSQMLLLCMSLFSEWTRMSSKYVLTNGKPCSTLSIRCCKELGAPAKPNGIRQKLNNTIPGPGENAVFSLVPSKHYWFLQ